MPSPAGQQTAAHSYENLARLVDDAAKFMIGRPDHPVVHKNPSKQWRNLLTPADCDHLIAERGIRFPFVQVTRDGQRVSTSAFTWGAGHNAFGVRDEIRPAAIRDLVRDGATVVFNGLARYWEPTRRLCNGLGQELGWPTTASAFLTPRSSQGFTHHHDTEDVFLAQMAGTKTWELFAPVTERPLAGVHDWPTGDVGPDVMDRLRHGGEPDYKFRLDPGDVLYFPRGWIHNGFCETSASLHVTIGLGDTSRFRFAKMLIEALAEDFDLRRDVAGGWVNGSGPSEVIEEVRTALLGALRNMDAASAIAVIQPKILAGFESPPLPAVSGAFDPSGDMDVAGTSAIHTGTPDETVAERRYDVAEMLGVRAQGSCVTIQLPDRVVHIRDAAVAQLALDNPRTVTLEDIQDAGITSEALAAMLREGILRPARPSSSPPL